MIFAGFLFVHEAVLGLGGLQPVKGVLVIGECTLHLPVFDGLPIHTVHIIGCTNTKLVHRLDVMLKLVLEQEPLNGPFGHLE